MAVIRGIACIWGAREVRPIINLPDGCKVRVRMRNDSAAVAFLRYGPNRIEKWILGPSIPEQQNSDWKLLWKVGENSTPPADKQREER